MELLLNRNIKNTLILPGKCSVTEAGAVTEAIGAERRRSVPCSLTGESVLWCALIYIRTSDSVYVLICFFT
jgi:hypothetical protein